MPPLTTVSLPKQLAPLKAALVGTMGLVVGWFANNSYRDARQSAAASLPAPAANGVHAVSGSSRTNGKPSNKPAAGFEEIKRLAARLRMNQRTDLPEFLNRIGGLNAEQLQEIASELYKVSENLDTNRLYLQEGTHALLLRLAILDARAAATWVRTFRSRCGLLQEAGIWKEIAKHDPALAEELIASERNEDLRGMVMAMMLMISADNDPDRALIEFLKLPRKDASYLENHSRDELYKLGERLYKGNPQATLDNLVLQFGSRPVPDLLASNAIGKWANTDSNGLFRWALDHCNGDQADLAYESIRWRIRSGRQMTPEVMSQLAEAMLQWNTNTIKPRSDPDEFPAVKSEVANLLGFVVPDLVEMRGLDAVRAWADRLPSEEMKNFAICKMTESWVAQDPLTASQEIADQPDSPLKRRQIEAMTERLVRSDPERAFEWSQQIVDPTKRVLAMTESMKAWLVSDPIHAVKTFEQMPQDFIDEVIPRPRGDECGEGP